MDSEVLEFGLKPAVIAQMNAVFARFPDEQPELVAAIGEQVIADLRLALAAAPSEPRPRPVEPRTPVGARHHTGS